MQYSPKLKRVMQQIKEILANEDVAASVVLAEPGFSEYLLNIETSFSCAKLQNGEIRVKTKGLKLTSNQKRELLAKTSNMLHHLSVSTGTNAMNLIQVSEQIDKILESKHTGRGNTSHNQQNN